MAIKVISPVNVDHRKKLDIRPGDTVRVWQKVPDEKNKGKDKKGGKDKAKSTEAAKFRLQAFEGLVLSRKHGREAGAMFTVRKVVGGVGVERIFPLYSPMIDEIEMVRRSKVRRAKLYFVREKASKEIRRQMRRVMEAKYEEEVVPAPVAVAADTTGTAEAAPAEAAKE